GLIDETFIQRFIQKNSRIIEFMSKTIDDFRNFFRIDKNKQDFSIKESVQNALFLHEAQLQTQMIAVKITGKDFILHGLKNEFEQVVLNLISNAKDAFIQNKIKAPVIKIDLASPCITISDNAGGILAEHIDKIFDPYFTTKDQGKGTGIGLYMSRMIIQENMHGSIDVSSKDATTQFTICFDTNALT
ncbi:MAG: sensor histidine kinase, partial [Campylobacterota bacterium]